MANLIPPYGGTLVDLTVSQEERESLFAKAKELPSIQLTDRSLCDVELLATGAFSPLDQFMGAEDYRRVIGEMRLQNGALFPIPITLSIANETAVKLDKSVALVDSRNEIVATMTVEQVYEWDLNATAQNVCGTDR